MLHIKCSVPGFTFLLPDKQKAAFQASDRTDMSSAGFKTQCNAQQCYKTYAL